MIEHLTKSGVIEVHYVPNPLIRKDQQLPFVVSLKLRLKDSLRSMQN